MKKRLPPGKPSEHMIEAGFRPSASKFDSCFRCPGKWALEHRLPAEEDTAATNMGRRIHKALETFDFSELNKSEARTASRIAYGESELVHEYGFEGAEVEFEQRLRDYDDDFNRLWSCKIDRYDWQPDKKRLLIIDDKTGWTLPPAIHENWQVRSEAALLTETLGAEEAVCALIHPHHPDSLWEARVYPRKELLDMLDTVRVNVRMIQQPDQRRIPGGIQCQWCTAKRICPEYQASSNALSVAIQDEIADEGYTAIIRRSAEERGEHVRRLKEMKTNIDEIIEQYVTLAVKEGAGSIKGWKLARKLDRGVTSESEAMRLTRLAFGDEAVYAALKFSVSSLEEKVNEKVQNKRKAKELVNRTLGAVLTFKESKNFLTESRSL